MGKKKNIFKSEKLKKLLRFISTKAFLGSVFFAIALWAYVNLNNEYITIVKLPLEVILPENRALEAPLAPTISVEVKGVGWNILSLTFFNTSAKCEIDLSGTIITQEQYRISRIDLLKSVLYLSNVEPIDVLPEYIIVKTGRVGEYRVDVVPEFKIVPREGFMVVGSPALIPDKITIKGNNKVVSEIDSWPTDDVVIEDAFRDFSKIIPLKDTLSDIIDLSTNEVLMQAQVQQVADLVLPGVELKVRPGSLPENHFLNPTKFQVTVSGPIDEIAKLTKDKLYARIDYNDVINDSTGIIEPKIVIPDNIRVLQVKPPYVYHVVRVTSLNGNLGG